MHDEMLREEEAHQMEVYRQAQQQQAQNQVLIDESEDGKVLSANTIAQLPRRIYNSANVEERKDGQKEEGENECMICMCEYENGEELLTLDCFHSYHTQCILDWFKKSNFCPICKHVVGKS